MGRKLMVYWMNFAGNQASTRGLGATPIIAEVGDASSTDSVSLRHDQLEDRRRQLLCDSTARGLPGNSLPVEFAPRFS